MICDSQNRYGSQLRSNYSASKSTFFKRHLKRKLERESANLGADFQKSKMGSIRINSNKTISDNFNTKT